MGDEESFLDLVKIILQYFLLPVLFTFFTYWFMRYRAKASKNDMHDKSVFDRINLIISSQDVADVVHNARMGYLAMSTHTKSDDLYYFNQSIENQFLNKKVQQLYLNFDDVLHKLSALYALAPHADFIDADKKIIKLIYHKVGNVDGAQDKLMRENLELASALEKSYKAFRFHIKKRFSI